MKVIAKVQGQLPKLVKALRKVGLVAEQKEKEVIVVLKRDGDNYKIPLFCEEMEKAAFQISASEYGGKLKGKAMVLCAENGAALRPYFVPRFRRPDGEHALFALADPFVSVKGLLGKTRVEIKKRELVVDSGTDLAAIKSTPIFSGYAEDLPAELAHYRGAVLAAHEKAQCAGCWHLHYTEKGSHASQYRSWDDFVKVHKATKLYHRYAEEKRLAIKEASLCKKAIA